ncbi:hypothetical protein GCK72_021994 [Caenorhabditis remanei]|uniref:T20D4.11-like domain-containing protein n=1 Tax=Caenorhabditis remanei TaxID=31234 RepID=A0A6A5GLL8_CAERE|nr:hypothetical protein GCK72_021994 [Caenorhabditis remanei]KAF1755425.1 hypothetical protein GCK72_021994 [Caenorhabditis remanei]
MKLLLLTLIFLPVALSSGCTTTDQIRFLQCKGTIVKIQDLLKLYAPYTDASIPPTVFKQISKLCKRTLTCVEQIECVEAKKGVSMMDYACEGIEMSSGPFGDCMVKLQSNLPDPKKYPCSELFEKDSLDTISKGCKMFTEDVECVKNVAKDYCGAPAADAFKKGIPFMKNLMKC